MDLAAALLSWSTLPALFVLITTFIIMIGFGLVVFVRTSRKKYGWYFALTMSGIGGWVIGDLLLLFARNPDVVRMGAEIFYIAPMIIPIFIWFFALSFPEDEPIGWLPYAVAGTAFTLFSGLFIFNFDFFIKDIAITSTLNVPTPALPGFLIYASFFSFFFILTYIAFLIKMKQHRGINRTQVAYTFFGSLLASIPALFTNLSLPIMGQAGIIWLGPFFTLLFAVAVTAAIIKHRLFDIRLYAVRSAAYLLALFATAALFAASAVLFSSLLLDTPLTLETIGVLTAITLVVAFLFQPLKKFFDRLTRHFFYKDAYDGQAFFNQFNQTLVENAELSKLLHATTDLIARTLKAEFCLVTLNMGHPDRPRIVGTQEKLFDHRDIVHGRKLLEHNERDIITTDYLPPDDKLRLLLLKHDIALLARLAAGSGQELGYIVLGAKKSGEAYSRQDAQIMQTLANELVIAVQNALRFDEIEKFNATLQEKIDNATRRLRRTNEKLRMLDQTKDDFISMASHQLRTPLTSVKGYVSMVLDGDAGKLTPLQRKLLNQSFISAQRMVYLISDLLNVSRLRTGKFIIEPVASSLAKVIRDEVDQLQETAKGRNLTLTFNRPEHFPTLMLDETKMRQVIMNFIDNAIYYTPSGGHIAINLVDKSDTIEFTVVDDGIGVPRDEQHHLFTKFYRAHNARRARPDGTGLGLFMAKKVIVAQGGAIIFRSQEGKGSTFGFTFAKDKLHDQPIQPEV